MRLATLHEEPKPEGERRRPGDLIGELREQFPSLDSYLHRFDIDTHDLHLLGSGNQGSAYSDGKYVVKFTEDTQEVKASARLLEKPVRGVNPIIHVGEFSRPIIWHKGVFDDDDVGRDSQFYVIIQDLQSTNLSPEERAVANVVGNFLVSYFHREESERHQRGEGLIALINKFEHMGNGIPRLIKILAEKSLTDGKYKIPVTDESIAIAEKLLEAVINMYLQAGIRFFDVQADNVAKDRDGNFVLIDIGVSTTKGRVPPYGIVESEFKNRGAHRFYHAIEIIN